MRKGTCVAGLGRAIMAGMRRLILATAIMMAVAGCSLTGYPQAEPPPHKFGAANVNGQQCQWVFNLPTVAGVATDNIVFTTTAAGDSIRNTNPGIQRVFVHYRGDQVVTVKYQTLAPKPTTTWRTMNNAGAGDATTANVDYQKDFLALGPDSRIDILTGGAAPTGGGELSLEICNDRTLGE